MKINKNTKSISCCIKIALINVLILPFLSCALQADDSATLRETKTTNQYMKPAGEPDLIRDLRYWDKKECDLIDNIYLRAVCVRKQTYRPHMNIFVTTNKAFTLKRGSVNHEKCLGFDDDYSKLYCLYTTASYYGKKEPSKAYELCQRLQEEHLIGECRFYMAASMVMSLEEDTDKRIAHLMEFCGEIEDSNWRSECYFLSADELAFLESADEYLDDISAACEFSEKARDFGCFSHVAMILPDEKRTKFCNIIGLKKKPGCYWGIGVSFLIESGDVGASVERCSLIEEKPLKSFCVGGVSYYAGVDFVHIENRSTASDLIQRCMSLPFADRNKKQCVYGLGTRWGFNRSPAGGVKGCLSVDQGYRKECFRGLSQGLLYKGRGFEAVLDDCSAFPEDYQEVCFKHAANVISLFYLEEDETTCRLFPSPFRKECYENMKEGEMN